MLGATAARAASGDLVYLTIREAAGKIRRKEISPVDLTEACLRRIDKLNPVLNAFITITEKAALDRARKLARESPRSPLHGIPIGLKDLLDTAGVRTTAGSRHWHDRVPAADADVVRRLETAGAIIAGKCNMDEFAYNFTSETSAFGAARNPWDQTRSPGGSSGGSAIAAATGMCFAALGSDTGGSIRLPAALCGITGLKPSFGLVSTDGAAPLAWSLDHVGPMCRSAEDARILLGIMAARPQSLAPRPVKPLRLGVPRAVFYDDLDAEVAQAVAQAIETLSALTAGVKEVRLPELEPSPEMKMFPLAYSHLITAEAYAFHEEMFKSQPKLYHAGTRRSIGSGAAVPASAYIRARRRMERLRAESAGLFREADLLITPTAPGPAFELGKPASLVFLRNCAPWNLYGLPSISIPCGFSKQGLPLGLQITGDTGRDDLVLALAEAYQGVTDWHTRRPPV
jgi:aspartyl-tRNA(Asn)/glutamyl-tRNA(Gln) amidotransferase subunit A